MPTVQWVALEARTQVVCGVLSVLANGFLMFLILAKLPPKLGAYKWLMLYTAFFELIYAFVNLFAGPSVHTFGSAFIVFQDMNNFSFSHRAAIFLIVTYCSCFGFSMAVFAGHFIYRYGAVDADFRRRWLSGYKQLAIYVLPFLYGFLWGVICWFWNGETPERTAYLRNTMRDNYRLDIDECAYISAHFWPRGEGAENGTMAVQQIADFDSFFGVGVMWGTSLISVVFFGTRCYRWISKKLEGTEFQSEATKSLQKQLFYALVVQSAIPVILMYAPAGMVFIFPMLDVELNLKYPFIGLTIAIYPAIDPLPTMLIIKSYRHGCHEVWRSVTCRARSHRVAEHSLAHSQVPKATPSVTMS